MFIYVYIYIYISISISVSDINNVTIYIIFKMI